MTITDVVNGWAVRFVKSDGSGNFVAVDTGWHHPRMFFPTRSAARNWIRVANPHGLKGYPVRARLTFATEE